MYDLTSINQKNFTKKLNNWYEIYKDFSIRNITNSIDGGVFSPMEK
jgi:hypothetical protein